MFLDCLYRMKKKRWSGCAKGFFRRHVSGELGEARKLTIPLPKRVMNIYIYKMLSLLLTYIYIRTIDVLPT